MSLGEKSVGWPYYEIETIVSARIAGKSNDELREIVKALIKLRKTVAGKSDDEIRTIIADLVSDQVAP